MQEKITLNLHQAYSVRTHYRGYRVKALQNSRLNFYVAAFYSYYVFVTCYFFIIKICTILLLSLLDVKLVIIFNIVLYRIN